MSEATVVVAARGADRWQRGHPWIYRSDVRTGSVDAGVVRVTDERGRPLGRALWSPVSEIRLRRLTTDDVPVDRDWWLGRIRRAVERREGLSPPATAYRLVSGEADGLPSLVVDRYGPYVVLQLLSAGLEAVRDEVLAAVLEVARPDGVLLRNDAAVRRYERLPLGVELVYGAVPDRVEVEEAGVRYIARPAEGQKTGAFLDQRENRAMMGELAGGRALDVFCYHGLFALHMAARATAVLAIDQSGVALEAARENQSLNDRPNIEWIEANAFDQLRRLDEAGERFETIVLDPPAFAKRRDAVAAATRGYAEINRRALRLLAPGGHLFTASCSFHLGRRAFLDMLAQAAADSGRFVVLKRLTGQPQDHPEVMTIPETGYLKGALLQVRD